MSGDLYRDALEAFVTAAYSKANIGAIAWSVSYHVTLGLAGVLSLVAGVLSQISFVSILSIEKKTVISIISVAAAVLTFLAGFGGFERKWQANRVYRNELEQVRLDLANPHADIAAIREAVRQAANRHNLGIDGAAETPSAPGQ
ncbi:hypothetical protein GOA77_13555 [Sinorhizobium meliloti]|uniref:hypothetical protein n=1 Tax=Rhizobium meliloti TaxID=382 RepID=UPI00037AA3B7|nr:hypothetical protein [Sinorhizobium meliloti]MDE3761832.1 hypothetical protein [Sinorhizobium meliloti]MDW9902882.1 hypothetical protein [Sinorhizobium meliloti]MDX0141413.1 hypothetical protein [Sinorhizobium meliloti]MDX0384722.1 hypothetical protein [Sinorhizobium meliloti]RVI87557.1 hypothetical protein CN188_02015 [Sinorhizobium meliloti]